LRETINSRSRHSRRTLPTQRSACAFAFGAATDARITWIIRAEDFVKARGELTVAVARKPPTLGRVRAVRTSRSVDVETRTPIGKVTRKIQRMLPVSEYGRVEHGPSRR
jgi:hypothetical protein